MKPDATEGDKRVCTPIARGVHRIGVNAVGSSPAVNAVASRLALEGIWQNLLAGGSLSRSDSGPVPACNRADTQLPVSPARRE